MNGGIIHSPHPPSPFRGFFGRYAPRQVHNMRSASQDALLHRLGFRGWRQELALRLGPCDALTRNIKPSALTLNANKNRAAVPSRYAC
jgi:hypothetical protein